MTLAWIIITLAALLLSALFSGIEIAFVTGDRVRVELDVKKGGPVSRAINLFYSHSEFFISTILVGNNIVLVVYGMGAAVLLEPTFAVWFDHNEFLVLLFQTLVSTGVILLAGEFIPKSIFRINPNASLRLVAIPTMLVYIILYPISSFTTWLSKMLMKLCGVKGDDGRPPLLSVGELNQYVERNIDTTEEQKLEVEHEVKIFHNALDFSATHIRDCMTPRNEMVAVDVADTTREELSKLFTTSGRSKIIVYKEDIDNILGYIHVSELFHPDVDWKTKIKDVIFAPGAVMANKMMRRLLAEKRSMAIVVDEFGGTAGLVTLEDLMEEILGDIQDEHDRSQLVARQLPDGSWEFSGRIEIETLNEAYGFDLPESDDYQTLAGYILNATGTIPDAGAVVDLGGLRFEVVRKTAARLELITVTRINPTQPENEQ